MKKKGSFQLPEEFDKEKLWLKRRVDEQGAGMECFGDIAGAKVHIYAQGSPVENA